MDKLGKMIRITDLRSVWPHEANDFTKWLAQEENLTLLSDAIDIELELEERESSVGSFNVDIFAKEVGTNRRVIIENQLEDTNQRDEHRQAIEWLNQHTDSNIGFFLLEIELWQIGDSEKAPRFNIVEKPNDWTKTMKSIEGLSNTDLLKLEFWTGFNEAMSDNNDFTRNFHARKAMPQHWYDLSIGSSAYHVALTNSEVEWREAKKACRIFITTNINPKKRECWPKAYNWFLEKAIIYKEIASKYGGQI